jgi:hypothetical protein
MSFDQSFFRFGRIGPGAHGVVTGGRTPAMGVQISPPGPVRFDAAAVVVYDPRTPSQCLGGSGGNRTTAPICSEKLAPEAKSEDACICVCVARNLAQIVLAR